MQAVILLLMLPSVLCVKMSEFCDNPSKSESPISITEFDISFQECKIKDFTDYKLETTYSAVKAYTDIHRLLRFDDNLHISIKDVVSGDIIEKIWIRNAKVSVYLAKNTTYIASSLNLRKDLGSKLDIYGGSFQLQGQEKFRIIHTNDVHCHFEDTSKQIGFARFVTFVNEQRKKNENLIVLDAGDFLQGEPMCNLENGLPATQFINQAKYDVITPGNHFWDFNQTYTPQFIRNSHSPYVTSNVNDTTKNIEFHEYATKIVGSLKFGFFGLTTPYVPILTKPAYSKDIDFNQNLVDISQKMVKKLKGEGCDIIICLSHLGCDTLKELTSTLVAKNYDGIDIIIDGHSHTVLEDGSFYAYKDYETLVVQTGAFMKYVGVLDFVFDRESKKIIDKRSRLMAPADFQKYELEPVTQELYQKAADAILPKTSRLVGSTEVYLDANRMKNGIGTETDLAKFLTTAYLMGDMTSGEGQRANVSLIDAGAIRTSIDIGEITWGELFSTQPFGNTMVVIEISGEELLQALRYGTSGYMISQQNQFPQVSGIKYKINMDKKADDPDRITDVVFVDYEGKETDVTFSTSGKYKIMLQDFLSTGGDGYTMFKGKSSIREYGTDIDNVLGFLESLPNKTIEQNAPYLAFDRTSSTGSLPKQRLNIKYKSPAPVVVEEVTVEVHDGVFDALFNEIDDIFAYTVRAKSIIASGIDYLRNVSISDSPYVASNSVFVATNNDVVVSNTLEGDARKVMVCSQWNKKLDASGKCVVNAPLLAFLVLFVVFAIIAIVLAVILVFTKKKRSHYTGTNDATEL